MKMTREERLAAGWMERWGLYDWQDGKWMLVGGRWGFPPAKRWGGTHAEMMDRLNGPSWNGDTRITLRRFWTRKRPASPPPLKDGDRVLVPATIADVAVKTGPDVRVCIDSTTWGPHYTMAARKDIVRAPKEK